MIISRLTERITLQPPVTEPDGMGGRKTTFPESSHIPVWAEFKKPTHETVERTGTVVSELFREIGIRYRADVRKGWRVGWGGRTFNVEHTYDYGKDATILICREVIR